jgi:hypothetical protein
MRTKASTSKRALPVNDALRDAFMRVKFPVKDLKMAQRVLDGLRRTA